MRLNKTVGLLAGTTALTLSGFCFGNADETNTDALAQIAELKAELAQLKARNGDNWLTEQRADQIRGIVQDVLADAETRASLQGSGATSGYSADSGFFISSADGTFRMNINGLAQFRWILNGSTNAGTVTRVNPATGTATTSTFHDRWGFEVRRARLDFSGVFASDWRYMLQIQYGSPFGNSSNGLNFAANAANPANVNVLEAYIEKDIEMMGSTFSVRGGQFKAPFLREWLVDDADQLAVDRSILSYYFYQGYSTGLQLGYSADAFRLALAYTNGISTPVQQNGLGSYDTSWLSNPTRYSFAGRGEFKLGGNWADFDNFNSRPGTESGAMVGLAGFYQVYNDVAANADGVGVGGATADVTVNFGGASLFAAFIWENENVNGGGNANPWGAMVQAGYFLSDDFEVFGRYSYANGNSVTTPGAIYGTESTYLSLITVGVNYFFSANVKLTADFGWSFNDLGSTFGNFTTTGFQSANVSNQYAIRTQLQLTF